MKYDEAKLWTAVVTQAIEDVVGKDHRLRKEALQWIYSSRSFEIICELANLDFKRLKNILSRFGVNKEGFMPKTEILKNNLKPFDEGLYPDKFYIWNVDGHIETSGQKTSQQLKKKKVEMFGF